MVEKRRGSPSGDEHEAKRARASSPNSANADEKAFHFLRGLPQELQDLVHVAATSDIDDVAGLFQMLGRFSSVDRHFSEQLDGDLRRNPLLADLWGTGESAFRQLKSVAASVELDENHKNAYLLPILTKERRKEVVADLLKDDLGNIPLSVGCALVDNVGYLASTEKLAVVNYAVAQKNIEPVDHDPFLQAVQVLENFEPEQRSKFLAESFEVSKLGRRARLYHALAKKMGVVDESDQLALVTEVGQWSKLYAHGPAAVLSRILTEYAGVLDKLSTNASIVVASHICELPDENTFKWSGMSKLAEKLDHLDEQRQGSVVSWISSKLQPTYGIAAPPEEQSDWRVKADAAHHLSLHRGKLSPQQSSDVSAYISDIVEAPQGHKLHLKAVLITHLDAQERLKFVESSLHVPAGEDPDAHSSSGVVAGLILRVADLSGEERKTYCDHICFRCSNPTCVLAINSAIEQDFDCFHPNDRKRLFVNGIDSTSDPERDEYDKVKFMSRHAPKASLLPNEAIQVLIDWADDTVSTSSLELPLDDVEKMKIMETAGLTALCFANWARQQMLEIASGRENTHVPGDRIQPQSRSQGSGTVPRSDYDERPRDGRQPDVR